MIDFQACNFFYEFFFLCGGTPYESMSKFLSVSYLMKTADVIMNFCSSHNTTDHT